MRKLAILAAAVAAAAFAPSQAQAQQQVVNCESFSRAQRVCAMDTTGGVQLVRTWSETPCIQGQTWGLVRGGVWVSGGCRAQFATSVQAGSGRYNTGVYDNNGVYNNPNVNSRAVAQAEQLCRRAVRSRVANRRVNTSVENVNRNNVRIAWAMSNGVRGTCRVNSDGNVTLRVNNR